MRQAVLWYMSIALLGLLAACVPLGAMTPIATVWLATATPSLITQTGSMTTPVTTRSPAPYPSLVLDATQEFAYTLKATGRAEMNMTLTALPTNTPTPTFPVSAIPCPASDLRISSDAQGATGLIVVNLQISNTSQVTCYLQGPPDIKLVDNTGSVLDIEYFSNCFLCNEPEPLETVAPAATQTAVVQSVLYGKIGMGPHEHLGVTMIWSNWCKPFPEGGVNFRLTLPDHLGIVEFPAGLSFGGRCDGPGSKSYFMISHYSHSP